MLFALRPLFLLLILACASPAAARVPTIWRLLDYIAVDYPGAVQQGRIVSQLEYAEMREFSATASSGIEALPAHPRKAALATQANELRASIARRAAPAEVDRRARALAAELLAAFPVSMGPRIAPDPARGAALYARHCAACHGIDGAARVPAAAAMEPPPIAFTDRPRARERSLFALYQVISQGLDGTAMASFAALPEADRWALALAAGRFAFPEHEARAGELLWRADPALRSRIADLDAFAGSVPAHLAREIGIQRADAVTAALRGNPGLIGGTGDSLALARASLGRALAFYRAGRRDEAEQAALAAYLEGFEPVEALLAARSGALVAEVEREMGALRAEIGRGVPAAAIDTRVARLDGLFGEADALLTQQAGSATATFLGALAILLREGMEALLLVVAMITFLIRADRRDMLRFVHGGWIAALAAGLLTWWAARNLIDISGAQRETIEGVAALAAAAILLFVGVWMHGKSRAGAWNAWVRRHVDAALGSGSAWLLFLIAFIAVYREAFETILFFAALGAQGEGAALAGGIAVATLLLAAIAWAMLRLGRRLPLEAFFRWSALLIAVLAVILAGKGVAALQEAGLLGVTPLTWAPLVPSLGVHPSLESILAQVAIAALLALGFARTGRPAPASA